MTKLAQAALIASLALAAGCQRAEARPPRAELPLTVTVVSAARAAVPRSLVLTGTLTASQESEVAADVAGKVVATHVERGDVVAEGAPLARIDVRAARQQAAEARAGLEAALADDAQARLECGRSDHLLSQRAISKLQHERDRARCTASAAMVRAAEARIRLAAQGVTDGVVRAPFAGLVAERPVSVGEFARPGSPVATILQTDPLRLELTVPEADVGAIAQGQRVRFEVSAVPGVTFEGVILYVGPSLRRASRDLLVEATVPNADGRLRPGMFAVTRVDLGTVEQIVVPRAALRAQDGVFRVFVVVGGRLEERVVRLGAAHGAGVAVLEGLTAGDRLVAPVGPEVHDGAAVAVR